METQTYSIEQSNNFIIDLLNKGRPFLISRVGHDIAVVAVDVYKDRIPNPINIRDMATYDGIYCQNYSHVLEYAKQYNNGIANSDALACFPTLSCTVASQNTYLEIFNLPSLHNRVLEPFYCSLEGLIPWTRYLQNKTILIISPFTESFKKQRKNGFTIFKNKNDQVFESTQKFIFYKSFNTLVGNHIHRNWEETLNIMRDDIAKLDFDIAFLGCGGYGIPLCNFIKSDLKKSAIYIGGGLQLLFGVMGKRWENNSLWKKIIETNNTKFIRPDSDERIQNLQILSGGSYW